MYKDLSCSRSPIPHELLDKHLLTSQPHLHLQEHARSPSQAWTRPSPWSSIKKKMGFHPNQNEWEMNVQRTHPIFLFKKSIKFFFFFWRFEQDFHEKQTTFKKGREWRAHSQLLLSLLSENGRILILKGNETLNLMVEKKSQKEIIWINLPLHLDGSRNKGT